MSSFCRALSGTCCLSLEAAGATGNSCSSSHVTNAPQELFCAALRMLPTRELLLLLVTLCSVDSVQLNLEESLSNFVSTLEQYATQQNDVVFVLDESGSVGAEHFPHELEMVEMIARLLTVSTDFSRIAVMTFSSGYVDHIDHIKNSAGYSMCSLIARVRGIPYKGGGTETSVALSHAKGILTNSRPRANRIIILISDGDANAEYSPSDIASRLRKEGVVMFAVGVASINAAELLDVATSPKHVYMLEDFTYITEINQKLRDDVKETHFDVSSSSMACNNPRCDSNAACACGARGGKYQCVCERGYFGMGGVGQCHPCPKGTYKDELGEHCKSCPKNSTTSGTGATSNAQCSCLEGYEGDPGSSKPCTPIACARLSPPEGGRIIPPNCGNTFGTSCDFLCKEGYCPYRCDAEALAAGTKPWNTLTKTPRVCQTDRLWSGTEFICEKVRCPALKNPKNAVINCANSSLEYGTECVINCDEGYEKIGGDILFCESNGQWRGNLPTCRAITCRPLQPKGRLKLQPSHCKNISKFNKICTYSCRNEGFTLLDKRTQKETDGVFRCLADGNWSHSIDNLRCKDIQPPRITCPKDILTHTLPNVPYSGQIAWESPTAKDNVAVSAIRIIEPLTLSAPADEPPLAPPGQFHLGETRVTYVAEDTSRLRSTPCAFFVRVTDNDPPKVMFCPDDIVIQYHKRSKTVSWAEPKFVDNAGTADLAIISSRAPGTLFSWGPKSEVSYNATDAAGNSATCSFGVTILPYLCPEFPPPRNGYVSCDSESRRQVCTVHCHVGYRFVFPPEPVYRCKQIQGGGVWATGTKKETGKPSRRVGTQRIEIRLPWPDCAVAQQPAKSAVQVVSTVATTSCDIDPAKLKLIKQQFIDELKRSGKANLICGPRLGECTVEKVHISCNDSAPTRSSDRRFRRENRQFGGARVISKRAVATLETANQLEEDVPLDPRLEAQLTISFSVDLPTDADLKTLLDECEICKNETIVHPSNAEAAAVGVALKSAVLEAVDTAIRKELPDAVIIGAEDTIVSECATGQVSNALNCAPVPAPYTLSFPNGYVSDYARVSVERNLRGLTVSFFMRTSQRDKRGTPVSYAFKHPGLNTVLDNAFALSDPNRLLLYFYQNSTDTGIAANDNRWHHCALTWSSETGIWVFYWDGEEKASDKSPASKGSYMFKGDVVLGQDQDSVGGGFSGLESFAGEIAELNVWDYTMPKDDVRQLGSTCGLVGNVVAWYAVRESIYGNALVTEGSPDFCSGHDCSNSSCHCSALSAVERNTCDKAVDACTHNPCKHNQVCTELSDGKGLCKCRGYEGRHCEFDIDECVTGEHACSHICVNTLGSYECSCPQGMVLNLDNKTCADSSYCTQGDTVYLVGDTWIQDCQHCTCDEGLITCSPALCKNVTCPKGQMVVHNPGDCCPSCSEEPLKCHLSGNGTLITFYQLVVPFVGREDNTLFQDCVNGDFIAYLDSSSDHKSVQLYIHCLSVTLYDNKTVLVNNNAVALPHKETSIVEIIEVENDQSVQVQTHGGVVVQLQSDGSFSVSAPKKLSVHMCGLCGSMNRDTGEYVQTTNHAPFFFSHSWMVAVVVVVVVVVVVAVAARAIKRHVWRLHPDTRTGNRSAPPPCAASGLSNAEVPLLLGVRSPGANTCAQTFELGRSSNPNSRQCGERETEEHIMMLCPATSDARRELQKAVPHPRT
ncbi:sushi, von Willebrand factor type A, EGF and pentraxin domain-containing protein 1-like isoform X4 [Ornithodoros turicata]|uniref:sushi, von Willebrand factor type A, EGF and pentraxin domain-containing protein 1-like isoform X4 n=1 Tax=Ornithodoros turicata TaxID=34597 RepID=UPI003138FDF3